MGHKASDFYCYHYFYVTDLLVKDDKRSLFEAENKTVFLVYKNLESKHKLAILDLENQDKELNRPLLEHDHHTAKAFEQEF